MSKAFIKSFQGLEGEGSVQGALRPVRKETMARMRKTTKRIWAIHEAVPAIPAKPKTAAMMAMMRKITA
jgi:hypothetical protein